MLNKRDLGIYLILLIAVISLLVVFAIKPVPQANSYHEFSDTNALFGIHNAINVLSSLPFLLIGLVGLWKLRAFTSSNIVIENRLAYLTLFLSIALVAFGSGYYHLKPENNTLLWDRLPMSLGFMSLFSIVISEFISVRWGKYLLMPLLAFGLLSVFYWHITELRGQGDLRWYALVQFYPMLVVPVILVLFPPAFTQKRAYWWLFIFYSAAKILEHYDHFIHSLLIVVSGHSLKHIAASIGLYILVRAYGKRERNIKNHSQ